MDRRKSGNGLTEYVLRHRRPLLLPDGDTAFREKHDLDPPDPGLGYCTSEIVVPMFLEGGVLGAINAITHQAGVRYSREHMESRRSSSWRRRGSYWMLPRPWRANREKRLSCEPS
jgi:hypothetical protein